MNKRITIFITVIAFVLLAFGISFAFFTASVSNSNNQVVTITSGTMALIFADGNGAVVSNLAPGASTSPKDLTLENTGNNPATATIAWHNLNSSYMDGTLTYILNKKTSLTGMYIKVKEGKVPTGLKDEIAIYTESNMPAGAKYYYQLIITLNDIPGINQNQDINARLDTSFILSNDFTITLVDTIKDKSNPLSATDFTSQEAYQFNQPATTQLGAVTEFRYVGTDPNNYVAFNCDEDGSNCELWRAIGIFETQKTIGGATEQRVKLVRESSIGKIAWNLNINEWSTASLKTLLNEGDYYNRSGTYATNGLKISAKNMIEDAVFYLGAASRYHTYDKYSLPINFYTWERGTAVYSLDNTVAWTGEIGLIYPSDFGFATSGGTTINRKTCLNVGLTMWDDGDYRANCARKSFLCTDSKWTITPSIRGSKDVITVQDFSNADTASNNIHGVYPVVYLKADILATEGDGTRENPYVLE